MLKTSFLNINFNNPLVLASGILGVTGSGLAKVINNGAGGATIKSLTEIPRTGHNNPTMLGKEHYFLNAVGFSNPGIDKGLDEIKKFKELVKAPLLGSIFSNTPDGFARLAEKMSNSSIDILEVDVSCPNVIEEFGEPLAYSLQAVELITRKVKENTNKPISIKLSANAWNIADIARVAEQAGANAITAVNTVSAMEIDVRSKKTVLHNKKGGMSGPALFPIALRCVYDIFKAVKIPIIGTGGVTTGEDALAMIMAGATLVGVGSAVYFRGDDCFKKIMAEMEEIMKEENILSVNDIRGIAHL